RQIKPSAPSETIQQVGGNINPQDPGQNGRAILLYRPIAINTAGLFVGALLCSGTSWQTCRSVCWFVVLVLRVSAGSSCAVFRAGSKSTPPPAKSPWSETRRTRHHEHLRRKPGLHNRRQRSAHRLRILWPRRFRPRD